MQYKQCVPLPIITITIIMQHGYFGVQLLVDMMYSFVLLLFEVCHTFLTEVDTEAGNGKAMEAGAPVAPISMVSILLIQIEVSLATNGRP